QLFAQIADVDVHHVGGTLIIIVPDVAADLVPGQNHSLVADEVFQNVELPGGQGDGLAAPLHRPGGTVHHQVRRREYITDVAAAAAQQYPQPGQQLVKGKGLDQIIVRP